MPAPSLEPHGLPTWAQVVSLLVALFLALLRAIEFFKLPGLYVRLTSDLFFRLIDDGEAMFCHAVLLARNGPVLIQDIDLALKRKGNREIAEKHFPLRILQFGEKVKGPALVAEHHFFSSSPLLYLSENAPLRAVYLGVQREYHPRQKRAVQKFTAKVNEIKRKYNQTTDQPPEPEVAEQAVEELQAVIENSYQEMTGLIQLEAGEYEATVEVKYENPGSKLWKRSGRSRSSISFKVEDQPLAEWKLQLNDLLRNAAKNGLTGSNDPIIYPTFQPIEFSESVRPL